VSRVWDAKRAALREHVTQLEEGLEPDKVLALCVHRAIYLPREASAGEGFAPLGAPDEQDREQAGLG
jgi:hypothetical protein